MKGWLYEKTVPLQRSVGQYRTVREPLPPIWRELSKWWGDAAIEQTRRIWILIGAVDHKRHLKHSDLGGFDRAKAPLAGAMPLTMRGMLMIRRYLILLGAKTTAGGTVKTASSFMSLNGVAYVLEGDLIDCPTCGTQGVIKCVPPRLDSSYNSKQYVLEHDLCMCQCSPPPQLIANQDHNCQIIDADVDGMSDSAMAKDVVASRMPESAADEDPIPLLLVNRGTKEPYRTRPYKLELPGRVIEGVTDADGFTQPLSASERASLTAWHVLDSAPAT
jgi:hypothetical protein